jgi:hypothetical protein
MNLEALKASLEKLKGTAPTISPEQAAEIELREAIATEKARIAEETAKLRQLAIDQAMDESGAAKGGLEALDLEDAGFFIIKAPAKQAYLDYQAKHDKGTKSATDDARFAIACVVSHSLDPMKLTDLFDAFPLAPTSIGSVALRLAGFKLQAQAKRGR